MTTEKDPFPDASNTRKGKTAQIALMKIHSLKINQLPARTTPAQLLVILLGVIVNVFMLLYGCEAQLEITQKNCCVRACCLT